MKSAWNHWYHITANPYGQWLRGDPRGWRERDHRLHVDGDYKDPPKPSAYNDAIYRQSKRLMKFNPVEFSPGQRRQVLVLVLQSLAIQKLPVISAGVGAKHLHLFVQCPRDNPKIVIGKAKNHVWMQMINEGDRLKPRDHVPPLWAEGSHPKPIQDKLHHVRSYWYILRHRKEGAFVWCHLDKRDGSKCCRHRRAGH